MAPPLSLDELRTAVDAGEIDTVLLCLADMQGRLQGKRLMARHFVDDVVSHGAEACNYLLAVDVEMNTVDGYAMSSWEHGLRRLRDEARLRDAAARPVARGRRDVHGRPALGRRRSPSSPRRARSCARSSTGSPSAGSPPSAPPSSSSSSSATPTTRRPGLGYRDLTPANLYNVDYSMLGTSRVEPLLRRIRNGMTGAGMHVENSKGECNFGQHEINFTYGPVLRTADEHTIYKNGAKEIADQEGMAITFMAKYDEREGNSCHIHLSLQRDDGTRAVRRGRRRLRARSSPASSPRSRSCACSTRRTSTPTSASRSAPSPRPRSPGATTTAPARCASSATARRSRIELRLPGADVNPYLAIAAIIAAGLHGMDNGLELEPPLEGNAYASDKRHVPRTLRDARDAFAGSSLAREAFGQEVVDHYLNNARIELEAFDAAVTDWERVRGFERL